MVTALKRISSLCALVACISVHGKELSAYNVGDVADQDIKAIVPFDVVDAVGTDALKSSKALEVPAIYREDNGMTNVIIKKFLAAFTLAHSNFLNALTATYNHPTIDDATIASPDFGYFLTAFNVGNKNFPVTANLAAAWARGDSGASFREQWLTSLLEAMGRHARPDKLPPLFVVRKNIRLVPLKSMDEKLSLADAQVIGNVVVVTNVPTITHARTLYRQQFPADDQPLARVLCNFIQPDCLPDVALTQQARDLAVRQIVVADHFDTGQIIIRRGKTIDPQTKAALVALSEKLIPGTLNQQIAAEHERALQEQAQAQQEQQRALAAQEQARSEQAAARLALQQQQQALLARAAAEKHEQEERVQADALREQALAAQIQAREIRQRDEWLVAALAAVSLLALLALWRVMRQTPTVSVPVPAKLQKMERPQPNLPPELAPFLAQTLKEAVVQGLAAQRAELLEAQRQAAVELAELVQRLDRLQAPMQERLRAYQDRIEELQRDLAQRTEENRELLKMKIEMMRRQLETERTRVKLN